MKMKMTIEIMTPEELEMEINGQKHIRMFCSECGVKFEGLEDGTRKIASHHMESTGHVVI